MFNDDGSLVHKHIPNSKEILIQKKSCLSVLLKKFQNLDKNDLNSSFNLLKIEINVIKKIK